MATVTKAIANYEDITALQDQLGGIQLYTTTVPANSTKNISCSNAISAIIFVNGLVAAVQGMYIYSCSSTGTGYTTAVQSASSITITRSLGNIAIANASTSAAARITIIVSNGSISTT